MQYQSVPEPLPTFRTVSELRDYLARTKPDEFIEPSRGYFIRRNQKIVMLPSQEQFLTDEKFEVTGYKKDARGKGIVTVIATIVRRSGTTLLLEGDQLDQLDNCLPLLLEGHPRAEEGRLQVEIQGDDNVLIIGAQEGHPRAEDADTEFPVPPLSANILYDDALKERVLQQTSPSDETPIVAVFDTGFNAHYLSQIRLWANQNDNITPDHPNDFAGWNFVNNTNDVSDDNPRQHGTRVAALISKQLNDMVWILPLKVLGNDGLGELMYIMEALEYVKILRQTQPITVANFSWGYNRPETTCEPAFRDKLREFPNILFVVAAGNGSSFDDGQPRDVGGFTEPVSGQIEKMYPAVFSDLPNLITITTVVSCWFRFLNIFQVKENFSKRWVNAGAMAPKRTGSFDTPLPAFNQLSHIGSSFATAIASGQAANLANTLDGATRRTNWLNTLHSNCWLLRKIRNGKFF